jgi:uncharacterized LabA/DUF88 family protein
MPDSNREAKTYSAFRSQAAAWEQAGGERLALRARKLKYPPSWPNERAREKGIDVWLAVDLVEMAIQKTVDRVVVVSTDTDLLPAIELALRHGGDDFVEVAGWQGLGDSAGLLHLRDRDVTTRPLSRAIYERLADTTDYTVPKEQRDRGVRR